MALIIVSATRQKNVRQKNKECVCLLHFSVSHFSVWLVSVAEMTTEAHSIKSNFLKHHRGPHGATGHRDCQAEDWMMGKYEIRRK
jgi:hypothetical protein